VSFLEGRFACLDQSSSLSNPMEMSHGMAAAPARVGKAIQSDITSPPCYRHHLKPLGVRSRPVLGSGGRNRNLNVEQCVSRYDNLNNVCELAHRVPCHVTGVTDRSAAGGPSSIGQHLAEDGPRVRLGRPGGRW
jgi:hypothetical protein